MSNEQPTDAEREAAFLGYMRRFFPTVALSPEADGPAPPPTPPEPSGRPNLYPGPRGTVPDDNTAEVDAYISHFFPTTRR